MLAGSPRILILKPSSLGDVVHTLPAVSALRAHWPESEISWLINPEWAPLLDGDAEVDRLFIFPRKELGGLRGLLKFPAWQRSFGGYVPDLALDFQGLLRTALIAGLLKSKTILGLSDAREGAGLFYHRTTQLPREPMHSVDRYLALAKTAGATEERKPIFRLPDGTRPPRTIPERFTLLHPFSRGAGKSLQDADVIQLCELLQPNFVVLVGGSRKLGNLPSNAVDCLGQTSLHELIWLIRRADFTVSVDSGPMHIASALTDRLLSIHTWSNPLLVGPYNRETWIWKNGLIEKTGDYTPKKTGLPAEPNPKLIADFVLSRI